MPAYSDELCSAAASSSPTVVCVAGQCLEGYTNTTSELSSFSYTKFPQPTPCSRRNPFCVWRTCHYPSFAGAIHLHIRPRAPPRHHHLLKRFGIIITRVRRQCFPAFEPRPSARRCRLSSVQVLRPGAVFTATQHTIEQHQDFGGVTRVVVQRLGSNIFGLFK